MKITTLSSFPGVPFNDTLETFFDTYEVKEDIECYQLLFCPYGRWTSFDDLYKIKFKTQTVILNVIDFIIDEYDNTAIDELKKFCEDHPENNFIIFNFHLGLGNQLKVPNLYLDTILSSNLTENLKHCEKKEISNRWLSLNLDTKLHRVMTVCYLLSKDYCDNGDFTFNMEAPTLVKYDKYKNITKISDKLRSDLSKGYKKFREKDFNLLNIRNFDKEDDRVASNYNNNLMPVYENIGVEIITGTMFFERTPSLSEKETQSVYGKNFPIYLNGVGMVREIKKLFGIDTFDDIIDNSYDEIEDHFERLQAAIDRNQHLLDGSTNIRELWYDNRDRFEKNCSKMDSMIFDRSYQRIMNHEKIKKALNHFNVSFE
jgi:hypothetical protein